MTRRIDIPEVLSLDDKQVLGAWPKREDIDEIIHEDVDVYLPNGELAIVFRVGALKSTIPVEKGGTLTPERFDYWKWVSRALLTDQRGFAAGKEIVTNPEIRLTIGQNEFFSLATKAKNPLTDEDEAVKILQDIRPSRTTYYVKKTEADGLVNLEKVEEWDSICRRRNVDPDERKEATARRNAEKLAWFYNWFEDVWLKAEDRPEAAKAARKRYITSQPRSNRCYSNVLGTIDRSGRLPFGRLTVSTLKRWEEFESNRDFYHEVNDIFRETHPDKFEVLSKRFADVKDERYNLFGTAFTTITINNNFQVAYHRDGNNAEGAVAALAVMEEGDWSGGQFVFPELRIGFDIREGDIFIGDNQGLIHGMLPFEPEDMTAADAQNVMFVFYQRDRIIQMDDLDCESCRKAFMDHNVSHNQHKGTGEPKWTGSWPGMWTSPEWEEFKKSQPDPKDPTKTLERCSNTNYWCT